MLLSALCATMAWSADWDTFTAETQEGVAVKYWIISEEEKTCMVGANSNPAIESHVEGVVTIPSEINGYKVIRVGERAFYNRNKVTSISLPSTITRIGKYAFSHVHLESIEVPEGVTIIEEHTFENCMYLTDVKLPSSLQEIGTSAFVLCSKLETISLPSGLKRIANATFSSCESLKSISIPNEVTEIETATFSGCSNLESISFPESLTKIGSSSFESCISLKKMIVPNTVISIGTNAFYNCSGVQEMVIPRSVESIGSGAFSALSSLKKLEINYPVIGTWLRENTSLETVTLGDKVNAIADNAFYGCIALRSINLTENITSIGSYAFSGCKALKEIGIINTPTVKNWFASCTELEAVAFGNDVKEIVNSAFSNCTKLKSITFAEGLQTIGDRAFGACPDVQVLSLPSTLTSVGNYAFGKMPVKELTLPAGLTTIGSSAFTNLSNLAKIVSKIEVPTSSTGFNWDAYNNAVLIVPRGTRSAYVTADYWKNFSSVFEEGDPIAYKEHTDEQGVRFTRQTDSSTKEYYYQVTGHGDALVSSIVIPASIANVPVTQIYSEAFKDCVNIQSVTLPESLTNISSNAFSGCTGLTDVISNITTPSAVSGSFTSAIYQQTVLQVPAGTKDAYMSTWWKSFVMYEVGETKPQREVTDEQGVKYSLTQSGDKVYYNVVGYTENIAERVTIPTQLLGFDVSYISDGAFANCTAMKWLFIPETVTCNYKSTAFKGCAYTLALNQPTVSGWSGSTFLTGIELGDAVVTISDGAFSECTGILSVTIPENVAMTDRSSASRSPFYGCSSLQEATVECERLGNWFNSLSSSLKKLHLGSKVKEITKPSRFSIGDFSGLEAITVDAGNTVFDSREGTNAIIETATNTLLTGCRTTQIPQSVTAIGSSAFLNQSALTELTIPAAVTSIGDGAFNGCTGLKQVTSFIEIPFSTSAFESSTKSSAVLRVPYLKTRYYKNVSGWDFTNITEMDGTPEQMAAITFADPEAKRICVEKYDRNGDGEISMGEAELVTTIADFRSTDLISFDELKFFTNVTTIQSNAFSGCKNLTSIMLPEGLTEIGSYAFKNCSSLKSITLPEGLTTIGGEAFNGAGLVSMTLPSTLTSIGDYALAGNIIYCNLTTPISVGTLMHNMSETVLVVPTGTEQAFSQAEGWKYFLIVGAGSGDNTDWTTGQVTVTVDEPGDLRLAIVERDEDTISRLKIKGKLNSEDLQYLVEGKGKLADLESLDLRDVTFQYGGEAYASKSIAQDDVWPIRTDITNYYLAETEQVYLPGTHTPGIGNYTMTTSVYGPNLAGLFLNKGYKHIVMPTSVKKAAADVFNGCEQLHSVEFSNGITEVDERAFMNCYSITSVDLQGVDSIHADAFNGCKMLQDVPHISGVKYLGSQAFKGCTRLTGDNGVLLLPLVDSIPEYTFYKCIMLSDVRLSESTKHIGEYAFSGCKTLPRITLPASLTVLSPNAFTDCTMLEEVNYTESLMQVDYTSFSNTPWIKSLPIVDGIKYMGHIAMAYDTTSGVADASPATLTFREGTTTISDGFGATMDIYPQYYNKNVTAISFPSTLKRIGDNAFKSRVSSNGDTPFPVKALTLPDALEEIGEHAFAYAPALTKLTLPENLKKIGNEAFYMSEKLTSVVYNTVEAVAQNLFSGCTSLELTTIGPKVQLLPDGIFSGCTNLAIVKSAERTAPTPLNIGNAAFMNCENLQRLTLPANMVEIGSQAFMGCTALKTFTASESLETIGSDAFNGCTALNSLTLNMGLKTIGANAFYGCTAIPSFQLPESLDSIGAGAFSGCNLLKELTIPASVTKLGNNFVGDCYNLTKLVVNMKQPANLLSIIDMSNGVVQEVYGYYSNWDAYREIHYPDVTLYVPDGTKELYRVADGWKKFDNIQELSGNDVTARNKVIVADQNSSSGMTSTVAVSLTNDITNFTAFQFDIVLPLGCTIESDASGKLMATKGNRYTDAAQTLSVEQLAVHMYANFVKYRFVCMSPTLQPITGTDGVLLSFPIKMSEKMASGNYKASLENVVFTQTDGTQNILDNVKFNLRITSSDVRIGDANGDGQVNVTDVVAITNYILGRQSGSFSFEAADLNGDGKVDISDVVKAMKLVMTAQ